MTDLPPRHAKRIIRPRTPKPESRPIIAVGAELGFAEFLNEMFTADELPAILRNSPPSIVVTQGFGKHLERLKRTYQGDPHFNYRVTPIKRYARPWNDGRRVDQGMIVDSICNWVGWKAPDKKTPNQYHYPLDPIWFLTTGIDELVPSGKSNTTGLERVIKLYDWAREVREWCKINGLQVKASAGGLAAQLLRDSRFYPEPRRKVPRLINDVARYQLPGNYYRLHANLKQRYRAIYLDMSGAHHHAASRLSFPSPNSLHAYGNWGVDSFNTQDEKPKEQKPYAPGHKDLLSGFGIYHVRLSCPHIPTEFYPPPYMERTGVRDVFLYSNELQLVRELGGTILGIHAAYISHDADPGLNRYAKFALAQIQKYPDWKPWLKPTLHATYGLLAARPVAFEAGHFRGKGEPGEYHMGNASIPVHIRKRPREVESAIANVIHRGMIEAEVRKEVLWFARYLTEVDGHRVLAIYADAIFVEDTGRPMRLLPPPWRIGHYLNNLRFHSATHFTSPQMSRLPGVPQTARENFIRQKELVGEIRKLREKHGPPAARGVKLRTGSSQRTNAKAPEGHRENVPG